VYCDNYLDGGYHIPHLHLGLNSELEMKSYKTILHQWASVQKCKSKSSRVGSDATYAFLYPNLAINRYGEWLDTNYVLPVAADRCVIVFDWYHTDPTPAGRLALQEQLDASRAIQDEDVTISESVQCGIGSSSYEAGRYSPTVEIAEYHFHKLLRDSFVRHLQATKTD
jgi:choline monooxygenase